MSKHEHNVEKLDHHSKEKADLGSPILNADDNVRLEREQLKLAAKAYRLTRDSSNQFVIAMDDKEVHDKRPLSHQNKNHLEKSGHSSHDETQLKTAPVSHPHQILYEGKARVPNISEPVQMPDLSKSDNLVTSNADHLLANEKEKYNCNFYTLTVLLGREPNSIFGKESTMLGEHQLEQLNFKKSTEINPTNFDRASSQLKEGDVILVKDPDSHVKYVHSAIVVRSKETGGLVIRQKFDADHPVVDLTPAQFAKAYLTDPNETVQVWRK